jgi:hypothetical protein
VTDARSDAAPAFAVDAVITWVDGDDPAHRARREAALGPAATTHAAAKPTRFADCGEVEYCVASLLRFAPWLRTVWIVADRQQPAFVARLAGTPLADRVRVVDHAEIFAGYEHLLPTYSNRSIEAMLWRIPGLAPAFLYLNDDMVLLRDVAPRDFFHADGVVLRGHWRGGRLRGLAQSLRQAGRRLLGRATDVERPSNHLAQQLSARTAGWKHRFFQVPHAPHPVRTRTCADWYAAHPGRLEQNAAYKLRSAEQFLTVNLAHHLELAAGTARVDNRLRTVRLNPASEDVATLAAQLDAAAADPATAFACIQSLDKAAPDVQRRVFDWLDRVVGRIAVAGG